MMSYEESQEIWSLIKDIKVAMMTTRDGQILRSRPMHNVQKDFDGIVWFFSAKSSHKMDELEEDHHANLSYADVHNDRFVSLSGHVSFTDDRELIDKFWNPFVAAWFPDGKEDPDITLLRTEITHAESWDAESNRMVQLYELAKANVKGEEPDLGENKKYA